MACSYESVPKSRRKPAMLWMAVATLAAFSGGCVTNNGVTKKTTVPPVARPVSKDAAREELLEKYNSLAASVKSLNATLELKTTAGSKYSRLIQEYHKVKAFFLAAPPPHSPPAPPPPALKQTPSTTP